MRGVYSIPLPVNSDLQPTRPTRVKFAQDPSPFFLIVLNFSAFQSFVIKAYRITSLQHISVAHPCFSSFLHRQRRHASSRSIFALITLLLVTRPNPPRVDQKADINRITSSTNVTTGPAHSARRTARRSAWERTR